MKKYIIGGFVRDILLKKEPHDKDYVVVGSSIEEMQRLGFKQVGKDFPVFLHPINNEEYALARTERKIGDKHTDFVFNFSPDITLYDDCLRRDFTCNAIAFDEENGEFIDYFNGCDDIKNRLIRIIDENNFKLDPLRILRAYRFAAVLDFEIEDNTKKILQKMIADGMLRHLTPERVWKETLKALQPRANSVKFFTGLAEIGGLHDWFVELENLLCIPENRCYHYSGNTFKHVMCALARAQNENELVKWAVLNHDFGKAETPKEILPHHINHDQKGVNLIEKICTRLRTPNEYKKFAKLFYREHMRICKINEMRVAKKYDLVKEISNNFHDQKQLEMFLRCFYADYFGEEVLNKYSSETDFTQICASVKQVFDIMNGINLKSLPIEVQERLTNQKGREFGIRYREYMINYLQDNLH